MVAVRTRVLSAELPLFAAFLFTCDSDKKRKEKKKKGFSLFHTRILSWSDAMAAGKENFSIPILVYHRWVQP